MGLYKACCEELDDSVAIPRGLPGTLQEGQRRLLLSYIQLTCPAQKTNDERKVQQKPSGAPRAQLCQSLRRIRAASTQYPTYHEDSIILELVCQEIRTSLCHSRSAAAEMPTAGAVHGARQEANHVGNRDKMRQAIYCQGRPIQMATFRYITETARHLVSRFRGVWEVVIATLPCVPDVKDGRYSRHE